MIVSMAYNRRLSVEEPWRYACPDCGSVTVERIIGGKRPRGKKYPIGAMGPLLAKEDSAKSFRCPYCGERKATVVDKKAGQEVGAI